MSKQTQQTQSLAHPEFSGIESALLTGDLTSLSSDQRLNYYGELCKSLGLNPLTKPFEYISFKGKTVLYAKKDATEQLRASRKISLSICGRERIEDVYVVTARAVTQDGRADESTGAVEIGNLRGADLANALMKAETKAKRRVTLSVCGLGFLDESELDTMKGASYVTLDQKALPQTTQQPQTPPPTPEELAAQAIKAQEIKDRVNHALTYCDKETVRAFEASTKPDKWSDKTAAYFQGKATMTVDGVVSARKTLGSLLDNGIKLEEFNAHVKKQEWWAAILVAEEGERLLLDQEPIETDGDGPDVGDGDNLV